MEKEISRRMMQFSETFSDFENVVKLSRSLSYSYFIELLPLKSKDSKAFYAPKIVEDGVLAKPKESQITDITHQIMQIIGNMYPLEAC